MELELEFLLAFRVCACVIGFSWFLWTFWYKEREIGQTRGGQIVKVALEVALWMWIQVACGVFRFLKYHIYDVVFADFLKRAFNAACTWRADVVAYMARECKDGFYRWFFSACLVYLKVCKMAKDVFRFILTVVVVVILSLVNLGKWMWKKVFYYAPTFSLVVFFIIVVLSANALISCETGVHRLTTTRSFFQCIDNFFQGKGSFVLLMQELEIMQKPDTTVSNFIPHVGTPESPTIASLICKLATSIVLTYKAQIMQNDVWMNTVRALLYPIVQVQKSGDVSNAILAFAYPVMTMCINLVSIWRYGGGFLRFYCVVFIWCMCIRCWHFGLWDGLVDWELTYCYLAFFAYVSSGSIKKKIIGFPITQKIIGLCARHVASAPGAASQASPTPSALSREVTPEGFLLLRPSHDRERERILRY